MSQIPTDEVRLAERLKQAIQNQPVNPYLEAKIRQSLREHEARRSAFRNWSRSLAGAAAAVLVVCLGAWMAYELGHLRVTSASQEAYIRNVSARVSGILRVGLGDHVHCTVFRKFPKEPILGELGPEYVGLLAVVKERIPARYRIVLAHRCSYHGRKFVHLALEGDSKLISLVITRKGEGESFGDLRPAVAHSGVSIYEGSVQRFAIAGFETGEHLAYLVSDLDEPQNLRMLAALAAPVSEFLRNVES